MNTTTTELVQRAMAAADMHDAAVTPAQWQFWMTQENIALSVFLARAGWTLNVKTQTITVTGSEAGRFELATTPLAIVAIHQIGDDGRVRPIEHNNAVDFLHQTVGGSVTGDPTEFRAYWDQDDDSVVVNFWPEPVAGKQFLVSYIPHPLKLVLSGASPGVSATSVNYPMGYEERVVLGLAQRALTKEESDTSEIERQIRKCEQMIEESVSDRVFAQYAAVRNVDNETRGWQRGVKYPDRSSWWFF